ncbi:MAG: hypothetical protein ACPKQO_07230 [Nitrososphaeraceae archaeon]
MLESNKNKKYPRLFNTALFLAMFLTITLTIVGINFIDTTFAQEDKQKNIEIVEGFFVKAYDEKDPAGSVEEYLSEDFLSNGIVDREQTIVVLTNVHEVFPDLARTSEPAVTDESGNFVAIFSKWNTIDGISETADLFKVSDGKIKEHFQTGKYPDKVIEKYSDKVIDFLEASKSSNNNNVTNS